MLSLLQLSANNDTDSVCSLSHDQIQSELCSRDDMGRTPLMIAALRGNMKLIDLYIVLGADLSAIDASGNSADTYLKEYLLAGRRQEINGLMDRAQLMAAIETGLL